MIPQRLIRMRFRSGWPILGISNEYVPGPKLVRMGFKYPDKLSFKK